jgi:hypothetical protein
MAGIKNKMLPFSRLSPLFTGMEGYMMAMRRVFDSKKASMSLIYRPLIDFL